MVLVCGMAKVLLAGRFFQLFLRAVEGARVLEGVLARISGVLAMEVFSAARPRAKAI